MTPEELINKRYNELSIEKRRLLYETFKDPTTLQDMHDTVQAIVFKQPPPTGEQFLDPQHGWLPLNVIESTYDHVRKDFLNIVNRKKDFYEVISMYGGTRLGKTYLCRLLIIYTIIFIHHLKEPALYYGLSPLTDLCIYIISFKFDKTRQLYLAPLFRILEKSKRFHKVKFQDQVNIEQEKYGCDKIVYSKATTSGEITLASGLQIMLGNDKPSEIIGSDIIQCYISEITYFIETEGTSEELIYQLYTDAKDRIRATVGLDYLTYVFLDSSANYTDSLIESHILKDLKIQPEVYFRWRSRWDARPHMFPKWYRAVQKLQEENIPQEEWNIRLLKDEKAFQVITGNGDIPAKLVTSPQDLMGIPKDLIAYVPIDVEKQFKENLIKSIKDIAGMPTSNESKFVQNIKYIENIFSIANILPNIEGGVIADASESPTQLLYRKVFEFIFSKYNQTDITLKRAPRESRAIGLDSAHSARGDIYGFCMAHKEWSRKEESVVVVADLCFVILPGSEGINLTAVENFIIDLKTEGNVNILKVVLDAFQSVQMKQNLKRINVESEIISVDTSLAPYLDLYSLMVNGTVKVGKNIFLKNNLNCLERIRTDKGQERVDHPKGPTHNQYQGDWIHSKCGINGKDCSDALARATHYLLSEPELPVTIYEDENRKFAGEPEYKVELIANAFKRINRA